jgi:hypothetical protein
VSSYSSDLYFQINTGVGISEPSFENSFSIYPNPNPGIFTIASKLPGYELAITNDLGEEILFKKIQNPKSEIDLSKQPNGIYFIHITSERGTAVKKIIIDK